MRGKLPLAAPDLVLVFEDCGGRAEERTAGSALVMALSSGRMAVSRTEWLTRVGR